MGPNAWEILTFLLWSAEKLARPTFRNLDTSYESWLFRNGFHKPILQLEKRTLIERDLASPQDRIYRLSAQGRIQALGGRDPAAQWTRFWDGHWRLVLFDVPEAKSYRRKNLRRYLRRHHFGRLQKSVWITPDPVHEEKRILAGGLIETGSLVLMEARPCAGESDHDIATGAWDFQKINRSYRRYLEVLNAHPGERLTTPDAARNFQRWARQERIAWLAAVGTDPLLPQRILPEGYLGREAWRRRIEVLGRARRQLDRFTHP
jgi:phenylacetic acid degradation operon negative regulatory protein